MRKILITLATLAFLASCGAKTPETSTGSTSTGTIETSTGATNTEKPLVLTADSEISGPAVENGSAVETRYILRDTDANGEVLDTNVSTGAIEKDTFKITLGGNGTLPGYEGSAIPGFEKALIGMRAGEVKSFVVSPEEGYGTGTITDTLPLSSVAPEFTITGSIADVSGIITRTIPMENLEDAIKTEIQNKKAGDVLEENEVEKIILKEKTDTSITLERHDLTHPFYGKKIVAGLEGTLDGTTAKIEKVEGDAVTIRIITTENPFTKETFKVGNTGKFQQANMFGQIHEIEITILEIGEDSVKVSMPNPDKMANKYLHFDVKVISVTPPTNTTPAE